MLCKLLALSALWAAQPKLGVPTSPSGQMGPAEALQVSPQQVGLSLSSQAGAEVGEATPATLNLPTGLGGRGQELPPALGCE